MKYEVYSWNVNGIRAAAKKGMMDWLKSAEIDILAVQETKAQPDQLDEGVLKPSGYESEFHSAQKKGYSGVATYYNKIIKNTETSMGVDEFDDEGRLLITRFEHFTLLNVYFPNGKKNKERLDYKMRFYDKFLDICTDLVKGGESLVICGDVNTAHKEIDLTHPKPNAKYSGFLPEERAWIDKFLDSGFVDTLRAKVGDKKELYTWWSMRSKTARANNVGWRIDYFYISKDLLPNLKAARIHPDVLGSDHCPISISLEF
jgi:exodeoxyribonuclease-3